MTDIVFVFRWWVVLFGIGLLFLPFTTRLFSSFFDRGYIFSKILGIVCLSYVVFLFATFHLLAFSQINTLLLALWILILAILLFVKKDIKQTIQTTTTFFKHHGVILLLEEFIFTSGLFLWSYIRGFQPDIHGLEKFMDFGFVNSILRSNYFPPKDMWYTPFPINYYYFGHLTTAVLTRLSNIPPAITFNLMLATLFAFTFSASFSIGANLFIQMGRKVQNIKEFIIAGFLTGFLVTCAGNLHTIYTLFKPYQNDSPVPFWQLVFSPSTYPNAYWYPNATRFIYHTIHEFPMYSFVVSDLHGHVLDIPVVLTIIAVLLSIITKSKTQKPSTHIPFIHSLLTRYSILFNPLSILLGFLLAIMYMTNAWDALIYFLFTTIVFLYLYRNELLTGVRSLLVIILGYFLFSLPFSLFFQPGALVGGIGIVCPPQFLITIGKIGPFYFESNHCAHSPLWQLVILYGFFFFWSVSFAIYVYQKIKQKQLSRVVLFVGGLFILGIFLIIIPEVVYMRDIYTTYYRANTMFKLVYQAFILLSLVSGFMLTQLLFGPTKKRLLQKGGALLYKLCVVGLFVMVGVYPFIATSSYYNLAKYTGLNGLGYLASLYPSDYTAIDWLNGNISGQPVILEAQGDSYTDYARISANTGLPTILGWTVHEWLWRGTYDIVPPRIGDITMLYETKDIKIAKELIKKYNVQLVYIGTLERKKYTNLSEAKFYKLGKIIYKQGDTTIFSLFHE